MGEVTTNGVELTSSLTEFEYQDTLILKNTHAAVLANTVSTRTTPLLDDRYPYTEAELRDIAFLPINSRIGDCEVGRITETPYVYTNEGWLPSIMTVS